MTFIDVAGWPLADPWQYPTADEQLAQSEHAVVKLSQWDAYQEQFGASAPGVWIAADEEPGSLLPLLPQLRLIVIEFSKSRDGRGFTFARILRERHQYTGDIRAAGPLLPDQFGMLVQCGYTSLLPSDVVPAIRWHEAALALEQARARPRTLLDRLSKGQA